MTVGGENAGTESTERSTWSERSEKYDNSLTWFVICDARASSELCHCSWGGGFKDVAREYLSEKSWLFQFFFLGFVRVTNCAALKISSECSRRTLAKEFYDCLRTCNLLITQMSLPMFQQILTNWFFDVVNRTFNSMLHFCHDMLTDNLNIEMNRVL